VNKKELSLTMESESNQVEVLLQLESPFQGKRKFMQSAMTTVGVVLQLQKDRLQIVGQGEHHHKKIQDVATLMVVMIKIILMGQHLPISILVEL
jgi:ribosomal protein L2